MSAGAISIRGLTRSFGARYALAPLELELGPGGVIGLLGPNGSGKTTLLRMLAGLVPPSAGGAAIDGVELAGEGTAVRRRLSFAPGEIALYAEMRAERQLDWLLRGREAAAHARARTLAQALGLPLARKVHAFSHGMKRQLLLCAALAPELPVRLLDEPTEGLDPSKRGEVLELLRADAARGRTILLSSHHLGEVDQACERLVFLNQGKLIGDERAEALRARARRLLRLRFPLELATETLQRELRALGGASVRCWSSAGEGAARCASLELGEDDARPFLARLAAAPLPAPLGIAYGQISLAELYRDLYGVEGV